MHLVNELYDCHRSRAPVLAIAAQIPSSEVGSGYFQETNPEHLFADLFGRSITDEPTSRPPNGDDRECHENSQ